MRKRQQSDTAKPRVRNSPILKPKTSAYFSHSSYGLLPLPSSPPTTECSGSSCQSPGRPCTLCTVDPEARAPRPSCPARERACTSARTGLKWSRVFFVASRMWRIAFGSRRGAWAPRTDRCRQRKDLWRRTSSWIGSLRPRMFSLACRAPAPESCACLAAGLCAHSRRWPSDCSSSRANYPPWHIQKESYWESVSTTCIEW